MEPRNELVFKLDDENAAQALHDFVCRELRFKRVFLKETFTSMALHANVSPGTIANMVYGKSRYPQLRTILPILATLDLEFDPVTNSIVRRHNVVELPKKPRKARSL